MVTGVTKLRFGVYFGIERGREGKRERERERQRAWGERSKLGPLGVRRSGG